MAVCGSQDTDPRLSPSRTEFNAAQAVYFQEDDVFQSDFPENAFIFHYKALFTGVS